MAFRLDPDKPFDDAVRKVAISQLEDAINSARAEDRDAILLQVQRRGRPATFVAVRLR